jgi:hypothetical protein
VVWIVKLVSIGAEGEERSTDVMRIARPDDLADLATLGLSLAEGKRLLAGVQREIVAAQARLHAVRRPECRGCGAACRVKDYRQHAIATLFGQVAVRLPRFRCAGCGAAEAGVGWPSHVRSTPELDRLRAQLSALMTYRTAAEVMAQVFPVDAGVDPETLRRHTFKVAEELPAQAETRPPTGTEAIVVTLDSTFIRSCEDGERHLEVRIGNVETATGRRQVFGAVAKDRHGPWSADPPQPRRCRAHREHGADGVHRRLPRTTTHSSRRRRSWPSNSGLVSRRNAAAAPDAIAGSLSSDGPERAAAKTVIVETVERLRWRLWNGKAKDAKRSIERIRAVMHHFRGEPDGRRSVTPSRKLWTALQALNDYLVGQSDRLVNYGERHRAGQRVGTALTEGTANFLVNRRMSKSQQMRWSRRGADRLLQVRCAVYNGTLGSGFGQRFHAANDLLPPVAAAA